MDTMTSERILFIKTIRYNREIVKKITKDHKYFCDPSFYTRLLYEICSITEDEDFPEEKIFDENYIIEFDANHKKILKNYDASKLRSYMHEAVTVYKQTSETETFPYMSVKEIRNLREEEKECDFKSFEKKIADIWEKYDMQEELVENGFACIYIQEDSPLILSDKKTDKRLRKIVKKRRKSKSAGKNEFKLDIMPKEEIGKMMSDKILNCLGIGDKRLLRKFCEKTKYEYTTWIRIYYSPSGTITRCQYILEFYVDKSSHRDCYYNPIRNDLIIMEDSPPTPLSAFKNFLILLLITIVAIGGNVLFSNIISPFRVKTLAVLTFFTILAISVGLTCDE